MDCKLSGYEEMEANEAREDDDIVGEAHEKKTSEYGELGSQPKGEDSGCIEDDCDTSLLRVPDL